MQFQGSVSRLLAQPLQSHTTALHPSTRPCRSSSLCGHPRTVGVSLPWLSCDGYSIFQVYFNIKVRARCSSLIMTFSCNFSEIDQIKIKRFMQKKRMVLPLAQTEWSNSVTKEKIISNGPHLHVYSRCRKQPIAKCVFFILKFKLFKEN